MPFFRSRPARALRALCLVLLAASVLLVPCATALADGEATDPTPVPSPDPGIGLSTATDAALACGLRHSLVLNYDGRILSFGDNSFGQLGDGTNLNRSLPTELDYPSDVVSIAAGFWHSLAVTSDGTVYAWGRNLYGQLGTGDTKNESQPVLVPDLPPVAKVAAGAHHSVALTMDGAVYAWGRDTELEVGTTESEAIKDMDGTILGTRVLKPHLVIESGAVAIAAGQYFTLVLMEDGSVLAFGDNSSGQLGDGTKIGQATPDHVKGIDHVVAIAAGADHALAIVETKREDGTILRNVWGWGSDAAGQLGQGRMPDTDPLFTRPVRIDLTGDDKPENDDVSLIAAGAGTSLFVSPFLDRTGARRARLLECGSNMEGALGLGSLQAVTRPRALSATSNGWTGSVFLPFEAVATSGYHTLLLGVKGQLGGMGRNESGQLGTGTLLDSTKPVASTLVDRIAPAFRAGASAKLVEKKAASLTLSWPAAADNLRVEGYFARFIDPDGNEETVDFGAERQGTVDGYDPTAPQVFRVFAYDEAGNVSSAGLPYYFVPDGMTYEQAFPTSAPEDGPTGEPTPEVSPEPSAEPTAPDVTEAPTATPDPNATPEPTEEVTPEPTESPDVTPGIVPLDPGGLPGPGWNPDEFGTPIPLEVPWDVDGFYGPGVVLRPFSLTPAKIAVAAAFGVGMLLPAIYLLLRRKNGMKG